jgi:hypothetical protein
MSVIQTIRDKYAEIQTTIDAAENSNELLNIVNSTLR